MFTPWNSTLVASRHNPSMSSRDVVVVWQDYGSRLNNAKNVPRPYRKEVVHDNMLKLVLFLACRNRAIAIDKIPPAGGRSTLTASAKGERSFVPLLEWISFHSQPTIYCARASTKLGRCKERIPSWLFTRMSPAAMGSRDENKRHLENEWHKHWLSKIAADAVNFVSSIIITHKTS